MTEIVGVVEGPYYGGVLVCLPYWKIINDTMSEIIIAQYNVQFHKQNGTTTMQ